MDSTIAEPVSHGQLGRRYPDRRRAVLKLGSYLTGAVPEHPLVVDHLSRVSDWNGRTNFGYGTCGPCSVANLIICTAKYLSNTDVEVTDDQIYDFYRRSGNPGFDPGTDADDNGVDMTIMLSELVRGGIEISDPYSPVASTVRALAFASVDVTSIEEIRAATSIFGGVLFGLNLDTAQQTQTSTGLWDYRNSPVWGGHAVFGGAYTSAASGADEQIITWQRSVGTTDRFLARQAEECYVVLFQPLLDHPSFQAGVDIAALAQDYTALTGRPFPEPLPVAPTPPVPPGDDPDLNAWARVAVPWVTRNKSNSPMDRASTALLTAKGYLQ